MIDIKYILEENDFLQLNLYFFKTQGKLKSIIHKTLIAYLIIILIVCGFLIWKNEYFAATSLFVFAAIISIFHSNRMKKMYLKIFKKNIKQYESRFNKEVELQVSDFLLQVKSAAGKFDFNLSQIDSIAETHDYFIIKLKIEALIIPKKRLKNTTILKENLIKLSEKLDIPFINDLNWKW